MARKLVEGHLRLVVKIARAPNTQLFEGQLELDRSGAVIVDRELRASRAGIFAVGDVVEVRALDRPIRLIEPKGAQPFWDLFRHKVELLPS